MDTQAEACELNRVSVTNTSQTLAQLGVTVNPRTRKISIQNAGQANIYVNNGVANAASFVLLPTVAGVVILNVTVSAAQILQFYCATSSDLNVAQLGD